MPLMATRKHPPRKKKIADEVGWCHAGSHRGTSPREALRTSYNTRRVSRLHLIVAWVGGTAFVASLLYVLYFYFVRLGWSGASGSWIQPLAFDVTLFTLFAVHHSVMPRRRMKEWFTSVAPAVLERSGYVWVSSVLLAIVCIAWRDLPGVAYQVTGSWSWALRLVQVAGIVLTIRASARLDVLDLAGIRQVQSRSRQPMPLQLGGPYTLVRHPIYLGWVAMVFAAPDMTSNRLAFATISTLYLFIATPIEERSLERAFGDSYREYRRRVRWRIVPGIY
jgi:protein-S-isoprenylcysteine O-methyltransferase Ste14